MITDGGANRNIVHLSVQKGLVSLFLKFNFEELIAVRTAAYMSYYNPIERVHARCNLALQSVGMMRKEMSPEMERLLKKANSNDEVRKLCEKHPELLPSLLESLSMPVKLLENIFGRLSLNDSPFQVLAPATAEEISEVEDELNVFGDLKDLHCKVQLKDYSTFKLFLQNHTAARTYSFHIFKCKDPDCLYHEPLRCDEIERFGEPIPKVDEDNSREYYVQGDDPKELHLPSRSVNPEKQKHSIPFCVSAQTAKNVGFTIRCFECGKARLIYAEHKLTAVEREQYRRLQNDLVFSCGGSFQELLTNERNRDTLMSKKLYTRENLSCSSNIELPYYSAGYTNICMWRWEFETYIAPDISPVCVL